MSRQDRQAQDMMFYEIRNGQPVVLDDMPDENKQRIIARYKASVKYRDTGDPAVLRRMR